MVTVNSMQYTCIHDTTPPLPPSLSPPWIIIRIRGGERAAGRARWAGPDRDGGGRRKSVDCVDRSPDCGVCTTVLVFLAIQKKRKEKNDENFGNFFLMPNVSCFFLCNVPTKLKDVFVCGKECEFAYADR